MPSELDFSKKVPHPNVYYTTVVLFRSDIWCAAEHRGVLAYIGTYGFLLQSVSLLLALLQVMEI